jgi:hypothetical protein
VMDYRRFVAILATTLLYAIAIINTFYVPHWPIEILYLIEFLALLIIVRFLVFWYRRNKVRFEKRTHEQSYWVLVLGIVVIGITLSSIIFIPEISPNLSAIGARIYLIGFIVGSYFGCVLVAQWFANKF